MSITPERLAEFDEDSIALLAKRLDDDDYPTPFDSLSDWHLLRALAIHRPDLTAPYVHLVDQEPFDED
ncbi:MAG: protein IsiD [Synechococcus sp.]